MITLITGAPGAGKTSALVSMLAELAKGRPVFVDGIPDLKVDHTLIDGRKWMDEVPDGSVVVIDEVQRLWRPAGAGSRVPPDIAALETHRHRGIDFYIVTQHPKLVHSNVRNLIGRHVHLREMGVMGRWWYEWPEAADPGAFRSAPVKKRYRLDKKTFALYRSASEHIKPSRSLPASVIILGLALLALPVMGWMVWRAIASKSEPAKPPVMAGAAPAGAASAAGSSAPGLKAGGQVVVTPGHLAVLFVPRLPDQPETAPAFDHLRQVVAMPRVVGGFCRAGKCRCFTQQGTDPGITHDACADAVRKPRFDPYRADYRPGSGSGAPATSKTDGDAIKAMEGVL